MSEIKNMPKLRFPEFTESWKRGKLREFSTFFSGGTPTSTTKKFYNGNIPFIKSGEINSFETNQFLSEEGLNNSSAKRVNKGDLLFALYGATSGEVGVSKIDGAINQAVLCIRGDFNNILLANYLKKEKNKIVSTYLQGGQGNLSAEIIKNLKLSLPSLPEQQKIADFLTAVDKRIELLEKKKTLLETFNKGVMKKIFNQEIRFKDDNGIDFPDWEEYILNDLGDTLNGLTGKTKDDFDKGSSKYIQYKQVFGDSKIDPNGFGLVDVGETEKQTEIKYGDILFTTSSETPNEIGMSSVFMSEIQNVYLNSFCFGFRPKSLENLIPNFSRFLFRSEKVRSSIVKLAQGSTRFNMSKTNFLKIRVRIPSVEEQVKISEFLSSIDNQIELLETQIDKSKTWKKGLLQKMFV